MSGPLAAARSFLEATLGYVYSPDAPKSAAERPPRLATIDPAYAGGKPRVIFDGETVLGSRQYTFLSGYSPVAGDRVLMLAVGHTYVIQGKVADTAGGASQIHLTGEVVDWPGAAIPSGYLECNGAAISRAAYAPLYAALGGSSSPYGQGDGSTTFNLPDRRGRKPVGYDSAQTEFNAIGKTGGAKTHTLTTAELAAHTHVQDAHNHTQNAHGHGLTDNGHTHTQNAHGHALTNGTVASSTHTHPLGDAGWAQIVVGNNVDGANLQSVVGRHRTVTTGMNWTATYRTANATVSASTLSQQYGTPLDGDTDAANGTTTVSVQNTTATNQSATTGITLANTTATNQSTTATNQNAGGGAAHNNLDPYVVTRYIIKT